MKITARHWLIFFTLSFLGAWAWFQLAYPQFTAIDFSISRQQATRTAEQYLRDTALIDTSPYNAVTIFISDTEADRYLQKAIGFSAEREFIKEHGFDLFYLVVPFFKEIR